MSYTHESTFTIGAPLVGTFTEDDVRHEPMFFAATVDFAYKRGGPITRAFIDAMPREWQNNWSTIIDSRAHMLQAGWSPCIPGWHHDEVKRGANGQPDYDNPGQAEHVMSMVNGLICPTVFLKPGPVTVPHTPEGQIVYGHLHPIIEELSKTRGVIEVPDATLVFFDWQTWHTGQTAKAAGWRWFARASRYTERKWHNDIRTQVNVYVPERSWTAGW